MTFVLMSLPFVGVAALALVAGLVRRRADARAILRAWALSTVVLVVLTIIFDNLMIAAGLFDYGAGTITEVRLVLMPIEDLLYPIAGAALLAGLRALVGTGAARQRRADA